MVLKPTFGRDSARFFRDPYKAYDKQRAKCPVERIENGLGMMPAWLITGYAEARAAFAHPGISKDIRRFQFIFHDANVPNTVDESVANSMVGSDPPDHTRLRKLAVKAFTSGAIEHLRHARDLRRGDVRHLGRDARVIPEPVLQKRFDRRFTRQFRRR